MFENLFTDPIPPSVSFLAVLLIYIAVVGTYNHTRRMANGIDTMVKLLEQIAKQNKL